ncbi:type II toxin-antitoxin system prevent-host-death family antitoxin [bacterium]|nr:type II toxin-antitoxin system prevent-host-death family antitoxin [bacterium]
MQAISLKDANDRLSDLVAEVLDQAEARIVVTESGEQVVLMPIDQFNAWQETMYLLSSPANARHLRQSITEAESGQAEPQELSAE